MPISSSSQLISVPCDIKAYQEVNEEFALKTIDALRQVHGRLLEQYFNVDKESMPVPVVWIHDYQLMLAAAMIRQVRFTFLFLSSYLQIEPALTLIICERRWQSKRT